VRILKGETPHDIKISPVGLATPEYDWRQLQRWGINESLLPPGSQVYFRDPSVLETYRWQIALIFALVPLQGGMITILLHERRRRHLAEVQTRQPMVELAHVNRHSMAGELTGSIAHELGQPLGSILTNRETAELMLKSPAPDLSDSGWSPPRRRPALGRHVGRAYTAWSPLFEVTTETGDRPRRSRDRLSAGINALRPQPL
jgi:hypothetical protein